MGTNLTKGCNRSTYTGDSASDNLQNINPNYGVYKQQSRMTFCSTPVREPVAKEERLS